MYDYRVAEKIEDSKVLIVAPHGHPKDDENSGYLAEIISSHLNCGHVINYGWQRSKQVDSLNNFANCNSYKHVKKQVVKQEFLQPIQNFINQHTINSCFIFFIHGMASLKKKVGEEVHYLLGWGKGSKITIEEWRKDLLAHYLSNFTVYEGATGGIFSACDPNNMTQAVKTLGMRVKSVQIETCWQARYDKNLCKLHGEHIANAIQLMLKHKPGGPLPTMMKKIKEL